MAEQQPPVGPADPQQPPVVQIPVPVPVVPPHYQELLNQVAQLTATVTHLQQQQQPPVGNAPQLKPPKPSTFHGNRRAVESWLHEVKAHLAAFPNTSEAQKLQFTVSCLRDHAVVWWQNLQASRTPDNKIVTCQQFEEEFKRHYQPVQAAETAREALYRLEQKGPVKTYIENFLHHVQYLPSMHEEDRVFQFTKGLQRNIARDVTFQRPKTLIEAMEYASRAETNVRSTYRNNYYPQQQTRSPPMFNQGPVPMEVNAVEEDEDGEVYAMSGAVGSRTSGRDTRRCYNCQQTGHIARYCRASAGVSAPRTMSNQYPKGPSRQ